MGEPNSLRDLCAPHDIALIVVEGDTDSAANQLLASLDKIVQPRCVVLVRLEDRHYNYLEGLSDGGRTFNTAWLVYVVACMAMVEDAGSQLF